MERTPETASAILILSIQPQHADRIFRGAKTFELRKSLPRERFGRVYLWENGTGAIGGCFDVAGTLNEPVEDLWRLVGEAGTTRERFVAYFAKTARGRAIQVGSPLRFDRPLSIRSLRARAATFRVPHSYLIVREGDPIYSLLEGRREEELQRRKLGAVSLVPVRDEDRREFVAAVTKLVSRGYDEITPAFARNILQVHDKKVDDDGFLTKSKSVFSALDDKGRLLGFTVLTDKHGGSAKTGPTLLLTQYQGAGFGRPLRDAIEELARTRGVRKLYCTCPAPNDAMLRHLLRHGYRIEAHLHRHYTVRHSELVFGKLLVPSARVREKEGRTPASPAVVARAEEFKRDRLVGDVFGLLSSRFSGMTRGNVESLLFREIGAGAPAERKPRELFFLKSRGRCVGAALLIPKRGGSAKIVALLGTTDAAARRALLRTVDACARANGLRKVFTIHPADDVAFLRILREHRFEAEGILRDPYRSGVDELMLSRFIL